MMIQPKVSLRDIRVRHVESDKWIKVGRFEYSECKKLEREYRSLGYQVKIDGALSHNTRERIKSYMRPGPVTIARMA